MGSPFKVLKLYPYGAVEIGRNATRLVKVNGSWLKHYIVGESLKGKTTVALPDASSA